MVQKQKATLLGVYENPDDKNGWVLSSNAAKVNASLNGVLDQNISIVGPIKKGKVRVFYGLSPNLPVVAVVGLGPSNAALNDAEEVNERSENIRASIASGVRVLRELGSIEEIDVDTCDNPQEAAEGGELALYNFDVLKSSGLQKPKVKLNPLSSTESEKKQWELGFSLASGQNFCRYLMENPANLMTPTIFAKLASDKLTEL